MKRSQLYWDDTHVGAELEGFQLDINPRRVFLQISGSQDWYPVHFDPAFARKAGHEDVFMNTGFLQAALVRVITDWMGDAGFLRKLYFEMRRQQRPGDTIICKGTVRERYRKDGEGWVELEVWAENERDGVTTPGKAWVTLPLREEG
jgi:acyl dehydratase